MKGRIINKKIKAVPMYLMS